MLAHGGGIMEQHHVEKGRVYDEGGGSPVKCKDIVTCHEVLLDLSIEKQKNSRETNRLGFHDLFLREGREEKKQPGLGPSYWEGSGGSRRSTGRSNVHLAAQEGDLASLQMLLDGDCALLNDRSTVMCATPLHAAAAANRVAIVSFLLRGSWAVKPDLEARNMFGETPLHVAAKAGSVETLRFLLQMGCNKDAEAMNGMSSLHLAVTWAQQSGKYGVVEVLLQHQANTLVKDKENRTPLDLLGVTTSKHNNKLRLLLEQQQQQPWPSAEPPSAKECQPESQNNCNYIHNYDHPVSAAHNEAFREGLLLTYDAKQLFHELEQELGRVVGLQQLKDQLRRWAKVAAMDARRRQLGCCVAARQMPHMAFLGGPGTGKTTVARMMAKFLHLVGLLPSERLVEVQRCDLVGEFVGHTGLKTRRKIKEAEGGVLFVDEAYRLVPQQQKGQESDFGVEALEELMSVMDNGQIVIIFAGYKEPMKRLLGANEGLRRRISRTFEFPDMTASDIALVMSNHMCHLTKADPLYGFRLDCSCTEDVLAELIEKHTTGEQRGSLNGALALTLLHEAREQLDLRLDVDCWDPDTIMTITIADVVAAVMCI